MGPANGERRNACKLADIYIGTAGYSYSHWRNGVFYPKTGVTQAQELRHYSGVFSAVEINASFHGVPKEETLLSWDQKAKSGFIFCFKVPKDITHYKRLEHIDHSWKFFLGRLGTMKLRLGPILFQLPPSLHKDINKLDEIAKMTPPGIKVAFEFRSKSWYCEEVFETMRRHDMGLCENISPDHSTLHSPQTTAGTWHYIRFHKQRSNRLETNYTDRQLSAIAEQILRRRRCNIIQYCYFLNDHQGNGPRNAKTLMKFVMKHSEKMPFVRDWKPDIAAPSIQSFFSKSPKSAATTSTQLAAKDDAKPLVPSSSRRKASESIDSFFSPATPSAKRQKLKPTPQARQKGTIESFFPKK